MLLHRYLLLFLCICIYGDLAKSRIPVTKFSSTVRFSNLYQDGMVLQREPEKATIWGYGIIPEGTEATIDCSLRGKRLPVLRTRLVGVDDEIWKMEVGPIKGGTSCNIEVVVADGVLRLKDVLFGDVWVCGGQSNMAFGMNSVYNAS